MSKVIAVIFIAIFLLLGSLLFVRFFLGGNEDTWICQDNEWVKHGNPLAPKPETGCGLAITPTPESSAGPSQSIIKESPKTGIANPASVYCEEQGGQLEIRIRKDGSQTGWCIFPDRECDEWEFFRTKTCQ
jgi:putative hemolysin